MPCPPPNKPIRMHRPFQIPPAIETRRKKIELKNSNWISLKGKNEKENRPSFTHLTSFLTNQKFQFRLFAVQNDRNILLDGRLCARKKRRESGKKYQKEWTTKKKKAEKNRKIQIGATEWFQVLYPSNRNSQITLIKSTAFRPTKRENEHIFLLSSTSFC